MKKSLIFSFVLLLLSTFILTPKVSALEMYIQDQSQQNVTGYSSVYSEYKANQTFKVTKNVLTKIKIYLKDRKAGGGITLTVKDENTGQTIVSKTQRMDGGDGWETFDLVNNEIGYEVNITHRFSMWVSTILYPDPAPSWLFTTDSDSYTRGYRRGDLLSLGGDHVFVTYGYDLPEEVPAEEPEQEDPVVPTEDSVVTPVVEDDDNITPPSTTPSTDEKAIALEVNEEDIEESVTLPTLESLKINEVDSDYESIVEINSGDILQLTGVAGIGDTVLITVGEKTFASIADTEGNWSLTMDITGLDEGVFKVSAQSKNSEEKASEKVDFFELNILGIQEEEMLISEKDEDDTNIYLYIFIGLLFLSIVGIGIYIVIKKRKTLKENTVNDPRPISSEEEKNNKLGD